MPFDMRQPTAMSAQFEYGDLKGGQNKNQLTIDHDLAKGHDARQVWYDGKRNSFLAGMHDGQLYIRGHGMPGENMIEGGRGGEKVRFDVVVDRIVKSGLPKTFSGKIKCYNCHSSESIDPTGSISPRISETNGECFAQLMADEMYSRGYKKCTYHGYAGSIDSLPKDGSSGVHKYVRTVVKGKQVESGRVSEARTQFTPNVVPKKKSLLAGLFK